MHDPLRTLLESYKIIMGPQSTHTLRLISIIRLGALKTFIVLCRRRDTLLSYLGTWTQ